MANDNPSSNLERAAEAADDFEKKHYQGGELDAQDFKQAGQKATAAVSNAATAVKEAVVGPADPKVCMINPPPRSICGACECRMPRASKRMWQITSDQQLIPAALSAQYVFQNAEPLVPSLAAHVCPPNAYQRGLDALGMQSRLHEARAFSMLVMPCPAPAAPQAGPAAAPAADTDQSASPSVPAASDKPAAADGGPSVITQLQDKAADALASLQQAVEPKPDNKSPDPEVNEFRSLVAEVFDNMKDSIASGDSAASGSAQQGPSGGSLPAEAGAAADAAQHKALASSPAEARPGVLSQVL